jgi:hypothetical protein
MHDLFETIEEAYAVVILSAHGSQRSSSPMKRLRPAA